ncbi:unnamed protein product [[Candida] boidinii]|nr:unnamed protein product [[Candida] boidinii]
MRNYLLKIENSNKEIEEISNSKSSELSKLKITHDAEIKQLNEKFEKQLVEIKTTNDLKIEELSSEKETFVRRIKESESETASNAKLVQSFKDKVTKLTEELSAAKEVALSNGGNIAGNSNNNSTNNSKQGKNKKNKNKNKNGNSNNNNNSIDAKELNDNVKETETIEDKKPHDHSIEIIELKHNNDQLKEKLGKAEDEIDSLKREHESTLQLKVSELEKVTSEAVIANKEKSELKKSLSSKTEEVDNLRDMLRDVGDELVTS